MREIVRECVRESAETWLSTDEVRDNAPSQERVRDAIKSSIIDNTPVELTESSTARTPETAETRPDRAEFRPSTDISGVVVKPCRDKLSTERRAIELGVLPPEATGVMRETGRKTGALGSYFG